MTYYSSDETRAAYGWHRRKPYGCDIHKKRITKIVKDDFPQLPQQWKKL